jgi:hypothetical protein
MANMRKNQTFIAAGAFALLLALLAVSLLSGVVAYVATGITAAVHALGVYTSATRHRRNTAVRFGALATSAVAVAAVAALDPVAWLIPVLVVSIVGWFAQRTLQSYMKPATELPAEIERKLSRLVQFSTDSVSGFHIGARVDGAVVAVRYVELSPKTGADGALSDRNVLRGIEDAQKARRILAQSGLTNPSMMIVVDRQIDSGSHDDVLVVDTRGLDAAVNSAEHPDLSEIAAVAEAAGIKLSRNDLRNVQRAQKSQGKSGSTKVKHQGRVTKSVK